MRRIAVVASSMLALLLLVWGMSVVADESSRSDADEKIAIYLSQIEDTLGKDGKVQFPDLTQKLVLAESLFTVASENGRQLMEEFPARLRKHAGTDPDPIRAINMTIFADVAEPFIKQNAVRAKVEPSSSAVPMPSVEKPRAIPQPTPAETMERKMLDRGDSLLSLGDVAGARLLFARVAQSNNGIAALRMASTYDPVFLADHNVRGIKPDPTEAIAWYRKALLWGQPQAEQPLRVLEQQALSTR